MTLMQGVVNSSDPRCLESSTFPGEMTGTCPSISSLRNSLRSACVSASTFIENPEHADAVVSQNCEGVKEQCQSGNTGLDFQVAFIDDYQCKMSELLDREATKGSNNVSQVGRSAVLATKQ